MEGGGYEARWKPLFSATELCILVGDRRARLPLHFSGHRNHHGSLHPQKGSGRRSNCFCCTATSFVGSVRSDVRPVGNCNEHEQRAAVRKRLDERRLLHSSRRRLCLLRRPRCVRHASYACPRLCDGCGRRRTEGGRGKIQFAIERAWSRRGREGMNAGRTTHD